MMTKHGLRGGVTPTLNAFDVGDTRATVLIIETPVLMRGREGKAGGGKGPLLSEDISLTIATSNDQVLFTPGVLLIDGTRVDDVRVYDDDISQTVISRWGTGGNNVPAIQEQDNPAVVRRLTPTECERLQGFPDGWTEDTLSSSMEVCVNITPAIENLLPELDSASCTIRGGSDMEVLISQLGKKNFAPFVVTSLVPENSATNTINRGSDTVILYNQKKTLQSEAVIEKVTKEKMESTNTSWLWNITLDGNLPQAKLSTTLTLIETIMTSAIFTCAAVTQNISGYIISFSELPQDYLNLGKLNFKMESIVKQADSHRYKQMGNAVTVNVIRWIGGRL